MKTIQLSNPVSIKNLKMKHNIGGCTLARVCIGYNDEVYFLFSDNDSEQVSKKNAQSNSKYMMIHGIVDWVKEELIRDECFDLGIHKTNHYLIQPIASNILAVRCKNRCPEKRRL